MFFKNKRREEDAQFSSFFLKRITNDIIKILLVSFTLKFTGPIKNPFFIDPSQKFQTQNVVCSSGFSSLFVVFRSLLPFIFLSNKEIRDGSDIFLKLRVFVCVILRVGVFKSHFSVGVVSRGLI